MDKLSECHGNLLLKLDEHVKEMPLTIRQSKADKLSDKPEEFIAGQPQLNTYKALKQ